VGESSFWYRPTRVVPDQRPLNGRCCLVRYSVRLVDCFNAQNCYVTVYFYEISVELVHFVELLCAHCVLEMWISGYSGFLMYSKTKMVKIMKLCIYVPFLR